MEKPTQSELNIKDNQVPQCQEYKLFGFSSFSNQEMQECRQNLIEANKQPSLKASKPKISVIPAIAFDLKNQQLNDSIADLDGVVSSPTFKSCTRNASRNQNRRFTLFLRTILNYVDICQSQCVSLTQQVNKLKEAHMKDLESLQGIVQNYESAMNLCYSKHEETKQENIRLGLKITALETEISHLKKTITDGSIHELRGSFGGKQANWQKIISENLKEVKDKNRDNINNQCAKLCKKASDLSCNIQNLKNSHPTAHLFLKKNISLGNYSIPQLDRQQEDIGQMDEYEENMEEQNNTRRLDKYAMLKVNLRSIQMKNKQQNSSPSSPELHKNNPSCLSTSVTSPMPVAQKECEFLQKKEEIKCRLQKLRSGILSNC